MMPKEKELVRRYWDDAPCGTGSITYPEGSAEYFEAIAEKRNKLEPFIADYARFDKWAAKKVLEVGCGVGSDLLRFARAGARVVGIDLSPKSVSLAKSRLQLHSCRGDVLVADAEKLPFKDNEFDLTYSWGVLHHTPNPERAIEEIYRVTKPGGEICVMLYHRHSLVAWQLYLLFGLFALRPFRSLKDIIANHHESPGTKAYSLAEARRMFSAFKELKINVCLTPYDLRYKRDRYLPRWVGRLIPQSFGWFMVIRGKKP
jgi:ubiquinone/menaquinone biosynthesis C-methylase UbiE